MSTGANPFDEEVVSCVNLLASSLSKEVTLLLLLSVLVSSSTVRTVVLDLVLAQASILGSIAGSLDRQGLA